MFEFTNNGGRKNLNHLREEIDYWHRPVGALREVLLFEKDKKIDYSELDNRYKEIKIGSLFLILLEKAENKEFWIGKTKNDPPDFVFMHIKTDEDNKTWIPAREVEIVRNVRSIEELEKTILSKDKPYSKDITILCYIETPGISNIKKISKDICSKIKNINDVFVLFHGASINSAIDANTKDLTNTISLVQISPKYIEYSIILDIKSELSDWNKKSEKLIYTKHTKIFYGLKEGQKNYPNII